VLPFSDANAQKLSSDLGSYKNELEDLLDDGVSSEAEVTSTSFSAKIGCGVGQTTVDVKGQAELELANRQTYSAEFELPCTTRDLVTIDQNDKRIGLCMAAINADLQIGGVGAVDHAKAAAKAQCQNHIPACFRSANCPLGGTGLCPRLSTIILPEDRGCEVQAVPTFSTIFTLSRSRQSGNQCFYQCKTEITGASMRFVATGATTGLCTPQCVSID
jgi:hypothetical protein